MRTVASHQTPLQGVDGWREQLWADPTSSSPQAAGPPGWTWGSTTPLDLCQANLWLKKNRLWQFFSLQTPTALDSFYGSTSHSSFVEHCHAQKGPVAH